MARSAAVALRHVPQSREVVLQRRRRPTKAKRQATDLGDAAFDDARLERQTYLTLPEFAHHYRKPSVNAARMWLARHPQVPTTDADGTVLVRRRDMERFLDQRMNARSHGAGDHARSVAGVPTRRKGHPS